MPDKILVLLLACRQIDDDELLATMCQLCDLAVSHDKRLNRLCGDARYPIAERPARSEGTQAEEGREKYGKKRMARRNHNI